MRRERLLTCNLTAKMTELIWAAESFVCCSSSLVIRNLQMRGSELKLDWSISSWMYVFILKGF